MAKTNKRTIRITFGKGKVPYKKNDVLITTADANEWIVKRVYKDNIFKRLLYRLFGIVFFNGVKIERIEIVYEADNAKVVKMNPYKLKTDVEQFPTDKHPA